MNYQVGIVVPTLGLRTEFLILCLSSIRKAGRDSGKPWISLVAPNTLDVSKLLADKLIDQIVFDSGKGLATAINEGILALPEEVKYVNWLGDDDLLVAGSLDFSKKVLDKDSRAVAVFGGCSYVDALGKEIWHNPSGQWAVQLLRVGPDLIPQPGALFRREAFNAVGGLNTNYNFAFDLDLFLKLSKTGKLKHINKKLASFRWHPESLTVEFRKKSVEEASEVRISHLPERVRPISKLWEWPAKEITFRAGLRVSKFAKLGDSTQ